MRPNFSRSFLNWQGLAFLCLFILLYFYQTAAPFFEKIPHNFYKVTNSLLPIDSIPQAKAISDLKKEPDRIGMHSLAEIIEISMGDDEAFSLKPWKLKLTESDPVTPNETLYYEKNGQGFVRKAIVYRTDTTGNGDLSHAMRLMDQPVAYKYDVHQGCILVPMSNRYKSIFRVLVYLLGGAFIVYVNLIVIEFVELFKNLKKGLAFTDTNVKALFKIGWLLLIYPLTNIFLHIAVWLLFKQYLGEEVIMKPLNLPLWLVITTGGFLFLLLHKAFLKGLELRREAELTI